jgi:hypothetical protein
MIDRFLGRGVAIHVRRSGRIRVSILLFAETGHALQVARDGEGFGGFEGVSGGGGALS